MDEADIRWNWTINRLMNHYKRYLPTSFIGKAIAEATHIIADGGPFRSANHANVFDGQDGEEQIFICPIIPVLVHSIELISPPSRDHIAKSKQAQNK